MLSEASPKGDGMLVYKISSLLEKKRVIDARNGSLARKLHKLLLPGEPFKRVQDELQAALVRLSEEGVATLKVDQSGRVTGAFWVNEDGRPNYAWLKSQSSDVRAKYVYEWLLGAPEAWGIDMDTGLPKTSLNKTLVDALELPRFSERCRPLASKLIQDLCRAGLVYDLGGWHCIVISQETRAAALRQVCYALEERANKQAATLANTQSSLFRLRFELNCLEASE